MRMGCLFSLGLVIMLLAGGNVGQAQDSLGMHCLSGLDYWQTSESIQMVGNLAYVASGASGLHIMSLADPINPVEIGRFTCNQWDGVSGVYVLGNRAYIAAYNSGFVLDISNPANPVILGQWESVQNLCDISFVHEDYAVAQGCEGEPYVLDISDPTNVHQIGEFSVSLRGVGMAGEYLCMTGCPGGLVLYDMTNPANPQWVASIDTTLSAHYATISGNYAYVATLDSGLRIIDLSNPLNPVEIAVCDSGTALDLTVTGSHAVVMKGFASNLYLNVWNVVDPTHPVLEGSIITQISGMRRVASSGNLVCITQSGSFYSVIAFDISNPTAPVEVSSFGPQGLLTRTAISGTTAYLADRQTGMRTVNISDPLQLTELAHMNAIEAEGLDVAVRENYAYVIEGEGGQGVNGIVVFEVSNPAEPESLGYVLYNGGRIAIEGDYAYAARVWQIATFSLANPAQPQCVNVLNIPLGNWGLGLAALNGYIYYASGASFYVCSLSEPAAPEIVGSCNLQAHSAGDCVFGLAVAGNYAYVADGYGGMRIVDVSDPTIPSEIYWIDGYWVGAVAASGNIVVMDDLSRISIYDVTNPLNPTLAGYYSTAEYITDMEIQGQYLFTTSISDFRVYQCDALTNVIPTNKPLPIKFNLLPPYPNPFNSTLTIPFTIPIRKEVIINIYNILGQRVQEFKFPYLSPGMHRVIWNSGPCASGLYIIHLISGGKELKQKVILLK
jgi:hypothetical protein